MLGQIAQMLAASCGVAVPLAACLPHVDDDGELDGSDWDAVVDSLPSAEPPPEPAVDPTAADPSTDPIPSLDVEVP